MSSSPNGRKVAERLHAVDIPGRTVAQTRETVFVPRCEAPSTGKGFALVGASLDPETDAEAVCMGKGLVSGSAELESDEEDGLAEARCFRVVSACYPVVRTIDIPARMLLKAVLEWNFCHL